MPEIFHGSGALAAFGGQLRLPMPSTFSGSPADWEEWSWKFKAYVSMYETSALQGLDSAETREMPITDEDLVTTLDIGDRDEGATRKTLSDSRKTAPFACQLDDRHCETFCEAECRQQWL